jgi:glycosyltransferase involved in cell wall biosynthesis
MARDGLDWQVAVFCQNEGARIAACLASISKAIGSRRGLITVIVNGSTDDSETTARAASSSLRTPVEIFRIKQADKANAINCYFHDRALRADAELYFCVDAYATIGEDALAATAQRFAECPEAVVATGVAINGRTESRSMRETVEVGGVMHGQFYALQPDFVRRMVDGGIRLPIGLYRGDGLIGSMAAHNLDAIGQPWKNSRVIGVAGATFEIESLSMFRLRDLRRQFRRKVRQMRGRIENAAVKQIIYSRGYAALPTFADDMIRDYLGDHQPPPVQLVERPFMSLAIKQHRAMSRPDPESLRPTRVA